MHLKTLSKVHRLQLLSATFKTGALKQPTAWVAAEYLEYLKLVVTSRSHVSSYHKSDINLLHV